MLYKIGIDIGSISLNTVVLDENNQVVQEFYDYGFGRPFHKLHERLKYLLQYHADNQLSQFAFTGVGGKHAAELLGAVHVNEIIAQSQSVSELYPEVKTIIEMGGEDSKLIFLDAQDLTSKSALSDFSMNNLCAAGTGSFLDQQAKRIGVNIINDFGELALQSEHPPRIAGRCSVFAKSDMIHLQQIATPVKDIIAGLCFAVARNLTSTLGRGKHFTPPVIFMGGVAANAGMVRAFREILGLSEEELFIPEYHASMGAIGAVLYADKRGAGKQIEFAGLEALEDYLDKYEQEQSSSLDVLKPASTIFNKDIMPLPDDGSVLNVFLGVDVGSLSTNVVLLSQDNQVVARRYLPTASKPIEAIRRGLREIGQEVGEQVKVLGAGSTGSGRYLTGDFIGADVIQNEITAQATATISMDQEVDTIFEIGGQDSKYISIENGVIVDFEMNKVCAAGTGSFLEEQAEKLDIDIKKEFESLAFTSKSPSKLGDRCTVFMESDLNSLLQKGEEKNNLIAGLAYSTVQNYLNRVVRDKPVGKKIYYQGGVTNNGAIVAAFEKLTGQKIHIPPHFDITGAIGAAMLARDRMRSGQKSRFRGFEVSEIPYNTNKFVCEECSNQCEIRQVSISGFKPLFYGGICDRYEIEERRGIGINTPNLFKERTNMLLEGYKPDKTSSKKRIGIPRGLSVFYQQFPFWRTLFEDLGFEVVLSASANKKMLARSIDLMTAETCLPIEMVFGHVDDLLNKEVDYVFLPFVVNMEADADNPTHNCNCPWIQSHPFMIRAAYRDSELSEKLLIPTFHFRYFKRAFEKEFVEFASSSFGISKEQSLSAIQKAKEAQLIFNSKIRARGTEVLANLPTDKKVFVVLGRPYNTSDPALNLNLIEKLIGLNVMPVPLDFLPLDKENIFDDYPMMYWPNGDKILRACRIISKDERLNAVFLGNFRCGPDSFLRHYMHEEMNSKPFLHLEVDEHSANAGMITRLEAYMDSLDGYMAKKSRPDEVAANVAVSSLPVTERTLYFPYANDVIHAFAAACRYVGMKAEVLPMPDDTDISLGRKYTNGQECFPFISTAGSFLKKLFEPGIIAQKSAFFMPAHNGPCRFGGYYKLHSLIFERLGFDDVLMIHPSNEDNYSTIAPGNPLAWRTVTWKGMVAIDLLRKMLQQIRPYEVSKGETNQVYEHNLQEVISSLESGAKNLKKVLNKAAVQFKRIKTRGPKKPVVAVVGEIFMRDNAYCSAYLVDRLEALGAETLMAPIAEWISYSTYRYTRDSRWKNDRKSMYKSLLQAFVQSKIERGLFNAVNKVIPVGPIVHVKDMLAHCDSYIHHDYDGDPPLSIGAASILAKGYISGVVNILPFTCMPGTLNTSITGLFKKDHDNIPWENFSYDGQADASIESRFQAFMHQTKEYARRKELIS
ncbi:MAG: CoA activase [Bacteroidetes bacterium]|jgi:predicted CoA-substrate-specific enzyme activase|nr:CoA activase [Bacteroidota bacterium]